MKVTREEGFKPITIVLETKEEYDCMVAHLQMSTDTVRKEAKNIPVNFLDSMAYSMYQSIKDAY